MAKHNKSMNFLLGIVEKQDKTSLLFFIGLLMSAFGATLLIHAWQNFVLRAQGGVAGVLGKAMGWNMNTWTMSVNQNPITIWFGIILFTIIGLALALDGLNLLGKSFKKLTK